MRRVPLFAVAAALGVLLGWAGAAHTQEARCGEMQAACLCSEPMNAGSIVSTAFTWAWGVSDGGTKKCSVSGVTGFISRPSGNDMTMSTDPTILALLPAGHQVARFLRSPANVSNIFNLYHQFATGSFTGVREVRVYIFRSANWLGSGDPGCPADTCNSGKIMSWHIDQSPYITGTGGWTGGNWGSAGVWSGLTTADREGMAPFPNIDPLMTSTYTPTFINGRWSRFALQIINDGGTPVRLRAFYKDVTGNGPVLKLMDTTTASGPTWSASSAANLHHDLGGLISIGVEWFRTTNPPGFLAASHMMYAQSATDTGAELIGAASEIESGGGATPPPATTITSVTTP